MAKNKREKGENSGSNKGVGILIGDVSAHKM